MDLRDQLQAHLGNAFTLERELGGGGMSRVFVANEVRLSRKVVVKVLSPELAQGLNAERFEREILLAASLQQANIVPVLAAGDIDGLPYFTMPFIEGESLRTRLGGSGLPIQDVIAILRDVTKALAYAHARNIVHRDIKPDNVLLSGGTAVVTDFGIAKALSASRTAGTGATLTSIGTSIGTPAYMAPEQVAGDPNLDHRVDLYALGCMAQELITGRAPFADRTLQKMLAAHLSENAPTVTSLRPDCPPALAALVTQLLRKDPADRPGSASDVLRALDALGTSSSPTLALGAPGMLPKVLGLYVVATAAVAILAKAAVVGIGLPDWVFPGAVAVMLLGLPVLLFTAYAKRVARNAATATPTLTPGGSMVGRPPSGTMATIALKASPHMSWRKTARGGVFAMAAFVLLVVAFMTLRALGIGPWGSLVAAGKLEANGRIVLADFTADPGDSALAPIVIEAVRAAMTQSRAIHLVEQADIAAVLQQMQRPRDTRLADPTLVRDVAQRTNATAILGGRLVRAGTGYAVSLVLTGSNDGAVLASFQATADGVKDLLSVVDGLTRKLRGKVGESLKRVQASVPLERATTVSIEALRKYSEAVVANDVDIDFERAVRLAREAVALDSTFALAWRKLAVALHNAGAPAASGDSAAERAAHYADRLPDLEKYLIIGKYYESVSAATDRGKSMAAYQSAYAADTTNVVATNQVAITFTTRREFDSAAAYFKRQLRLAPNLNNAVKFLRALAISGDLDGANKLRDSLIRANPTAANSSFMIDAAYEVATAAGRWDSARIVAERWQQVPSASDRVYGLNSLSSVEAVSGHLIRSDVADSLATLTAARLGGRQPIFGLAAAAADIVTRGQPERGVRRLDDIVSSAAWKATSPLDRPYLYTTTLFAIGGRVDRARDLLSRYQAESPAAKAPSSKSEIEGIQAELALAEGKPDEAVRLFRAADVGSDGAPNSCDACLYFRLARAFDRAGAKDSATAYLERYLAVPILRRETIDWLALPVVHKRLAELYDERHDKKRALEQYGAFVDLWKSADADLQPVVNTVKKRMAELATGEGK